MLQLQSNGTYYSTDAQQYIDELNQIFIDALGEDVNTNPESPNGYLIQQLSSMLIERDAQILYFKDSLNLNKAVGAQLDNLGSFNLATREAPTKATVDVTCVGTNGVTIPTGYVIANEDGDLFQALESKQIVKDPVTISFQALEYGVVNTRKGQVNQIINPLVGLGDIDNLIDGSTGSDAETDANYRDRIALANGINASGTYKALLANILAISPLGLGLVVPNNSAFDFIYSDQTIPPYGTLAVFDPTSDKTQWANIMYEKASSCCATAGNTEISYTIPNSNNAQATYNVLVPDAKKVYFRVSVKSSTTYPSDAINQIKQLIVNDFNGELDNPRPQIYQQVYATRFITVLVQNGYIVTLLKMGDSDATVNADSFQYPVSTYAVTDADCVTVVFI